MNAPHDDYDPYFDDPLDDDDAADNGEAPGDASRNDHRARSFPAFPAGARGGRRFARTWWGNAWIEAMESAAIDPDQLPPGRRYAHAGHVGPVTVSPGQITSAVHDGDFDRPYRTSVRLSVLGDQEWARFLDRVASKAGHIAALLDGEMPHDLVSSADDAGVRLLPGVGDLDPSCDCPDWNHPCKHAAALSYQAAWLLDTDPFVLLLMRGRERAELLAELRLRDTQPAGDPEAATVTAAEAFAAAPRPLPEPPARTPGPALLSSPLPPPEEEAGAPDAAALTWLAADAVARARALLAGDEGVDPLHRLSEWADAVRMAAALQGADTDTGLTGRLEQAGGRAGELPRAVSAWRWGGELGLDVLENPWTPPPDAQARARRALDLAWGDAGRPDRPPVTSWRNRWTLDDLGVQLRYGRDGRWYPYRRRGAAWWPAGPPLAEPDAGFAGLLEDSD